MKVWSKLFTTCLVAMAMFSFTTGQVSANYYFYDFQTEDGVKDLTNVHIKAGQTIYVNIIKLTYHGKLIHANNAKVRLCNEKTDACTPYKTFKNVRSGEGYTYYSNMKSGSYWVDIVDSSPSYYTGQVGTSHDNFFR